MLKGPHCPSQDEPSPRSHKGSCPRYDPSPKEPCIRVNSEGTNHDFRDCFYNIKVHHSQSLRAPERGKHWQTFHQSGRCSERAASLWVSVCQALSAPTYLTVCEGGCCVQGGVDQRARQVWDRVQRHVPMDVGVQVQSGVCGLLRAQELVAWRKGSGRHG